MVSIDGARLLLLGFLAVLLLGLPWAAADGSRSFPPAEHDLTFAGLASSWDEGLPLGNGMLGALVWQKDGRLRISLDRADLWDLRPMKNLNAPEWKFSWVIEQWKKKDYGPVQDKFDAPYDAEPAPSKIPAGALEIDLRGFGATTSARLVLQDALARVAWSSGKTLETFVQADQPVGWFRFQGAGPEFAPRLAPPAFQLDRSGGAADPVTGQDLRRLGYEQGTVKESAGLITYHQKGWGDFYYDIAVAWKRTGPDTLEGAWSISSRFSDATGQSPAADRVRKALQAGFEKGLTAHRAWWRRFWAQSSVTLPDKLLERQWYLEQYKFGSAARRGAPPISLQAVWTADNGKLPPWKGDFHHDLNTQLSYWPCYSGNHLEEGLGFLDWLWSLRAEFKRYTRSYFGTSGLDVPGVTTLTGQPMGGWIPYSFSPTVAAWLAHHFYLHWRYSLDRAFLADRAYPWIKDVAVHLSEISVRDAQGRRRLPLSSSPEINDNSREAWFADMTNYDLALVKWTFRAAAELAGELGLQDEAGRWTAIEAEWPDFAVDPQEGLMFAPGFSYHESHRHFSHQMAFHPLGLIDWSNGERDRKIIRDTLANLDRRGTDWWCGYSFSWLAGLRARAFDGEGAAAALRIFAVCFCLPNSFHVNGDQSGTGKSKFTYRPFTLEGNFACASGLQEMLIQSHAGVIRVFPALPPSWKEAAFDQLRAQGAFLVSAQRSRGETILVKVISEKGGTLRLANPFTSGYSIDGRVVRERKDTIELTTRPGQSLTLEAR